MGDEHSTRFLIQMVINVLLCSQGKKRIQKIAFKKQSKKSYQAHILFLIFAVFLIGLNQGIYLFFKPLNLYEQLEISRSTSPEQIKANLKTIKAKIEDQTKQLKISIFLQDNLTEKEKLKQVERIERANSDNLKKIYSITQILTHPAQRLSYDTFGQTDTAYAWAFNSPYYLISSIISSSIFYVVCTFINLISDKKGQIKQVFKLQILVMILLFLWEVQLIMKTQTRIHQYTDSLDLIYKAFPYFERRQMIKAILIPSMNIIKYFYRFFVVSESKKKFLQLGKNSQIRKITSKTSQLVAKQQKQVDDHIEERIQVAIKVSKKNQQAKAEIFDLQRNILKSMIEVEGENIFLDEEVVQVLKYFSIMLKKQSPLLSS